MPFHLRKLPRKDLYRVYNSDTKEIKAYATTKEKADKLIHLLRALEHGWKPSKLKKTEKKHYK